jgi:hypothetical protein
MVLHAPKIFAQYAAPNFYSRQPNIPATEKHGLQAFKDIRDDIKRH